MSAHFDDILSQKIKHTFQHAEVVYEPAHWQQVQANLPVAGTLSRGVLASLMLKIAAMLIVGSALVYLFFELNSSNVPLVSDKLITEQLTPVPQTDQPTLVESPAGVDNQADDLMEDLVASGQDSGPEPSKEIQTGKQADTLSGLVTANRSINTRSVNLLLLDKKEPTARIGRAKVVHFADSPILIKELVNNNPTQPAFDVFASSLVNYSDTPEGTSFGIGGGFSSSFPLTKKVRISSGLSIAQQSIGIESGSNDNAISQGTVDRNISADLFTVDIPLNLQFDLPSRSGRKAFITAGLSSFLYLREDFLVTTTETSERVVIDLNGDPEMVNVIQESTLRTSRGAFSRLDFARVLNLSMGYNYSLNTKLNLIIEPYIKYPIGNITSKNIQFGSGGVHIRLGFK